MTKAKLELKKHIKDGKVQIEIIVWNSCANEDLHNLVQDKAAPAANSGRHGKEIRK